MNAFLLVIAIGLAVLDFTCFWIFRARDVLPPVARISAPAAAASAPTAGSSPAVSSPPVAASPASATGQSKVVPKPGRPAGAMAGF